MNNMPDPTEEADNSIPKKSREESVTFKTEAKNRMKTALHPLRDKLSFPVWKIKEVNWKESVVTQKVETSWQ